MNLERSVESTSLATLRDGAFLGGDQQIRFRIVAFGAQHILTNEAVQQILQLGGVVRSVDNETLVLRNGNSKILNTKCIKIKNKI